MRRQFPTWTNKDMDKAIMKRISITSFHIQVISYYKKKEVFLYCSAFCIFYTFYGEYIMPCPYIGLFICQSNAKPKEIQVSLLLNSAKVNIAAGNGLFRFILQPETTGRNNDALSLCITLGCICMLLGFVMACFLLLQMFLFLFFLFINRNWLISVCQNLKGSVKHRKAAIW